MPENNSVVPTTTDATDNTGLVGKVVGDAVKDAVKSIWSTNKKDYDYAGDFNDKLCYKYIDHRFFKQYVDDESRKNDDELKNKAQIETRIKEFIAQLPPPQVDEKLWKLLWADTKGETVDVTVSSDMIKEARRGTTVLPNREPYQIGDKVKIVNGKLFFEGEIDSIDDTGAAPKGGTKYSYNVKYTKMSGREVAVELRNLSNSHYAKENTDWFWNPRLYRVLVGEMVSGARSLHNPLVLTHY